jgi:hypothetical protein
MPCVTLPGLCGTPLQVPGHARCNAILCAALHRLCPACALQAEEAERRAEQQAAEAAKRAAEREERLRRAKEYQEPEWVRVSEAAQQDEYETEVR